MKTWQGQVMKPIVVICYLRQSLWHRRGSDSHEALWKEFPIQLMALHDLNAQGRRLLAYLPFFLSHIVLRIPLVAEHLSHSPRGRRDEGR